jgi:hypothetical protein
MTHKSRLNEWDDFFGWIWHSAPFSEKLSGADVADFQAIVATHIQEYTIPQYGDLPDDFASTWSQQDCIRNLGKYIQRKGKNSRQQQHGLDCIKRAHYACIAYFKEGDADKQTLINHAISACEDYYNEHPT